MPVKALLGCSGLFGDALLEHWILGLLPEVTVSPEFQALIDQLLSQYSKDSAGVLP